VERRRRRRRSAPPGRWSRGAPPESSGGPAGTAGPRAGRRNPAVRAGGRHGRGASRGPRRRGRGPGSRRAASDQVLPGRSERRAHRHLVLARDRRASRRLATLAQVSTSSSTTAPQRTRSTGRPDPTCAIAERDRLDADVQLVHGEVGAEPAASASSGSALLQREARRGSRATTPSQVALRGSRCPRAGRWVTRSPGRAPASTVVSRRATGSRGRRTPTTCTAFPRW
jgi:hypothetical protein